MMTVVYMNNDDIYQLFLKFNVPGVRKEAGRLWKGVHTGDAGVMNELLQAACDPSAGQRAVQAGEAVQQTYLAEERRFELKRKADVFELELAERRLELKKSTDFHELEVKSKADLHDLDIEERKLIIQKQKFDQVDHFIEIISQINSEWRTNTQLTVYAQDLLCAVFVTAPRLVAPDSAQISEVVAPGIATAPDSAEISEVVALGTATAPDGAEISEVVAPQSAIAADGASAERFESFSQEVREMLEAMELRLAKLSQDSVAKHSTGDSAQASGARAGAAGETAGAAAARRSDVRKQTWRGKVCAHGRRGYRCRFCKDLLNNLK